MKIIFNLKKFLFLTAILGSGAALFIINLFITDINERESQAITAPWMPLLLLLFTATSIIITNTHAKRGRYLLIGIAILIIYVLSLRSVILHPAVAEVSEYWLGIPMRSIELNEFNEKKYCAEVSFLSVKIHSNETSSSFTFFRGLWPAYFSSEQIEKGIFPLSKCVPTT
jgi:hypothetical protein